MTSKGAGMATIVMTGGTSGFGAIAARRMMELGDAHLILGARRPVEGGESIPLDLASLDSVRAFAGTVRERLGDDAIDALVLNAGVIRHDDTGRTVDGCETTFAVNHLAHYLLARLLSPSLADGATVVMTTSGTHDPATGAGLATPRHADARLLAYPERDPGRHLDPREGGQHAYTASKLCAILTARSLNGRAELQARGITAIAYDPGQVLGTGLARDLALPMRMAWQLFGSSVLGWPLRRFSSTLNTRVDAGTSLADLALGLVEPPAGHGYAALRRGTLTWLDPSPMARDDDLARRLWHDSAELVGLPGTVARSQLRDDEPVMARAG